MSTSVHKPVFAVLGLLTAATLAVGSYSTFAWYSVKTNISVSSQTISISTAKPDMGELLFQEATLIKPVVANPALTVTNGAFTDLDSKLKSAGFRFASVSSADGENFATKEGNTVKPVTEGYIQIKIKASYSGMHKFRTNMELTMGNVSCGGIEKPQWLRANLKQYKAEKLSTKFPLVGIEGIAINGAIFANEFPDQPKGYDTSSVENDPFAALQNTFVCGEDVAISYADYGVFDSGNTFYVLSLWLEGTVADNQENLDQSQISFALSLTADKVN